MHAKFFLVAQARMTQFKLHKEGEPWEQTFATIRQAVNYVRSLPAHDGEVIVLNASGKEISHISVEVAASEPFGDAPAAIGDVRDPNRFLRLRARRSRPALRSTRARRSGKPAAFPWLRWLLIALIVGMALMFLMWRWPGGFTPLWISVFPAALVARNTW
jgi:hypothetical protein